MRRVFMIVLGLVMTMATVILTPVGLSRVFGGALPEAESVPPQPALRMEAAIAVARAPDPEPAAVVTRAPSPVRAVSPRVSGPQQVPVLLYHHLEPGAKGENGAVVDVREFEAQMAWLKERGFVGITVAELGAWLSGKGSLPKRPVLITFDDGYRSNYEYAYPVLERYGLKGSIFVISGEMGKEIGGQEYLGGAELQEMERAGVIELQAHTHDGHREIDGIPALKRWGEAEIRADIKMLQQAFAEAGVKRPIAVAYPYGAYDGETIRALTAEGIQLGFTVKHGYVRQGDPPMELKRVIIYPGISMCRFGELVTGGSAGSCGD